MRRRLLLTSALGWGALAGCAAPGGAATPAAPGASPGGNASLAGLAHRALTQIGFASCIDQTKPQPIWDAVIAGKPDLFVFGGDNVYSSEQPWSREKLQQAYATEAAVPGFARLRREIPHLAIWDDHDYGINDGGAEFPFKAESKEEFLRFWGIPESDPRRSHGGVYHSETFGPPGRRVQVVMLDARWFRSRWKPTDQRNAPGKERYVPDDDPAKTMLGEEQWLWLEARLREPADLRFIVSGIQVLANGHGWECWANFPRERERLYRLIAGTRANGVVLLSGDRHIGAIYRQAEGLPYPLAELTSSGITHPWRDANEAGPNRLALFTELHYGTADIDWSARSVQLALRDINGQVQRAHRINMDELQVRS